MHTFQYPLILLVFFIAGFASLFGNENGEDEFYILPDFVVTDDDDKGYYSANTLAGTRTNELTKNIPMTISTVNAEMIEDFKMKTLEDLGNFVPSIEAEGNVYNNQEIRFRGLLTRSQLYEFMPRYSPLDWYNVGRSDIIRGANSLIYGQADPGGKVNVISKTANLNKDKVSVVLEVGDKDWTKFTYDENMVLGDNTAARFMFVDKHREFDANYKYQSFTGGTIEFLHAFSPKTRFRLHLETGEAERSLIGGTFKVGNGPTGLPNGIVADPKLADLVSDEFLQEIANYSLVNSFDGNYDSIYPYSNSAVDPDGNSYNYGFIDLNSNGLLEKNFSDMNLNNTYDREAPLISWVDGNDDGIINITEPFEYVDANENGIWDGLPEPFATIKNGRYDIGEAYENPKNGVYDVGEVFIDLNNDGIYDPEIDTWLTALDGTGDYQEGATFTDSGDYTAEEYGWTEGDNIQTIFDEDGTALFSYIDSDNNGRFDFLYNPESRQFVTESTERFAYIDSDNNGQWDPTVEPITSWTDTNGDGTLNVDEVDTIRPTKTTTRNLGEGESIQTWVPMDEPYDDINNNGIYDDSDFASGGLMVRATNPNIWGFSPAGGTLVPDFIDSREDIRNLFKGIDYSNSGTGFGPDSYSKKRFDYILADFDHTFNDNLSMKVSFAYEDLIDKQLSSGWSANQINFSSGYGVTVRFPTLRSINAFYADDSNSGLRTPFEAVLVDLTNANYAHLALENIENNGLEAVRDDMKTAMNTWATTEWSGSFSSLTTEAIANVDSNEDGVATNDEIVDYWVDNYLDLSEADTELEKLYELAKFGGRVQNFLKESHSNYNQNNGYSYLWGFSGMGDPIYNALTDSNLGAPQNNASTQIFELDRYVNVPQYREQIRDWDQADSTFNANNYLSIEQKFADDESLLAFMGIGDPDKVSQEGDEFFIDIDNFSLEEDGERLIYDSIPTWLLKGTGGVEREMRALPQVELYDINTAEIDPTSGGYDGQLNVNNDTEVDLQRRAMAKRIYDYLVDEINDPNSDSEFWDGTKKIYDFFKYELHNKNDYGWMWEQHIQPGLLSKLDAIVEDTEYLTDEKTFVDLNGDGVKDETLPSVLKSSGEILEPFIRREWKKSNNRDSNKSARITFNYDLPKNKIGLIPGEQKFLLGIDLDRRNASRSEEQLVSQNVRTWGDLNNLYLRTDIFSDYVPLMDVINQTEGEAAFFDYITQGHQSLGAPNWITNNKIPYGEENLAKWANVYLADAVVKSNGLWLAASGSYNNGKLRTLFGIRRDHINTESEYSRFTLRAVKAGDTDFGANTEIKSQDLDETIYCPSIGALYWLTQNIAIFGNYSESVISPNGFQFDVFGDITPPETGQGKEIGFKVSSADNVINGQLTVFSIDKKNEQRQNISWSMLTSIYPAKDELGFVRTEPYENGYLPEEIYDFIPYEDRLGNKVLNDETGAQEVRAIFNPKGYRVADEEVRSKGLELDLYYNPNKNISVFFGYAYLETTVLESALDTLEGLPTAGTSDHNLNFTFKYSIKQGKFKGFQYGFNQKYRSAALLNHYFADLDGDGQSDYFPVEVENRQTGEMVLTNPRYNTLWLEDQHSTDVFLKWSGKFKKHHPWTVLQCNINNIFNNRNLISTGLNNARYTEGRNIVLSAGFYF
ncbi:MAG: TonB-dependent receptor plug domain-containing protein [Coraliomargaritaceae bacterium]